MTTLTQAWTGTNSSTHRAQALNVFLWLLQAASAVMFLFAGSLKLNSAPLMVQEFGMIGLGQWFRYLTGSIEVGSAVLLLIPSAARFGAAALAVTMIGAIATHLFVLGGSPAMAIVLLASTITIAWGRR
jgi:putative oxidoreductase